MAQTNEAAWTFDNTTKLATHRQTGTVIEFGDNSIGNGPGMWERSDLGNGCFAALKVMGSQNRGTPEIIGLRDEAVRLFGNRVTG